MVEQNFGCPELGEPEKPERVPNYGSPEQGDFLVFHHYGPPETGHIYQPADHTPIIPPTGIEAFTPGAIHDYFQDADWKTSTEFINNSVNSILQHPSEGLLHIMGCDFNNTPEAIRRIRFGLELQEEARKKALANEALNKNWFISGEE